ncbi:MAG TPA: phage integrase SAM-like domain-containing protein, partial [Spirochaetota bacterium]|nr:phage integrase SAM-like domain-containing protein [Spirochaetota bacterium]
MEHKKKTYTKEPYKVFKRGSKTGGRIYYVQVRRPDGSWSPAKSTGETVHGKARVWALNHLEALSEQPKNEAPTLAEYARGFFDYDGLWARDRRVTGRRISPRNCSEKQRLLEKYILDKIGDLRLTEITKPKLKELRNWLFINEKLSGSTVNKAMSIIKSILEQAEENDLVETIPKVGRVVSKPEKIKGILTIEEARRVLAVEWDDYRAFVMSLSAASTGMRLGELLGLQIKNYFRAYIEVDSSWDTHTKKLNPSTKSGKARSVIIPKQVQAAIDALIEKNPYRAARGGDAFIFYSDDHEDRPADPSYMTNCLFYAMERAGISEEERRARNITFHSWRYF